MLTMIVVVVIVSTTIAIVTLTVLDTMYLGLLTVIATREDTVPFRNHPANCSKD